MESRYKVGYEFPCTLVIDEIDVEDSGFVYGLAIKELPEYLVDNWTSEGEIAEAFDPEYKRQKLLAEKERIENELKELEEM